MVDLTTYYIYNLLNKDVNLLHQDEIEFIDKINRLDPNYDPMEFNKTFTAIDLLKYTLDKAYGQFRKTQNFIEGEIVAINEAERLLLDNPTENYIIYIK